MAKFSVLKKTRDLKDVWLRRASFLPKKPERALFESPLDVASDRSRKAEKMRFLISLCPIFLREKIRSGTCNRAVEVIQKFAGVSPPPPQRLTYI